MRFLFQTLVLVHTAVRDLEVFSDDILTFQMLLSSFLKTPLSSRMGELNLSETRMNSASLLLISYPGKLQ